MYAYVKKFFRGVGGVIQIVTGTVFSYLGILSNILGTIMGILASLMTIGIIAGICVYNFFTISIAASSISAYIMHIIQSFIIYVKLSTRFLIY